MHPPAVTDLKAADLKAATLMAVDLKVVDRAAARPAVRREWRVWGPPLLLAALALAVHGSRLTTLPLRGEETRRATVAIEILDTGDWIVPRQQGEIYLSRPPVGSWPMAALAWLNDATTGRGMDDWCVRAPTVAAIVLTTLLIYWYALPLLPGCGPFCAAAGFAGMIQVLQLGRLGETEGLFTLWVAASLLGWHGLKVRGVAPWIYWTVGYALAGVAGLTKGPQGPVAFVAGTWAFCLLTRDWRTLLSRGHVVGMLGFAATAGLWQAAYVSQAGWENGVQIWRGQSSGRFHLRDPAGAISHWVGFPLIVLACTLPGSLFAPSLLFRKVRGLIPGAGAAMLFCFVGAVLAVLPVWAAPGGIARYVMPCYPLIAVLGGAGVEGLRRAAAASNAGAEGDATRRLSTLNLWRAVRGVSLTAGALATPAAAVAFVALSHLRPELTDGAQPIGANLALVVAATIAGAALWASRGGSARSTAISAGARTAAAGVAYAGTFTTARATVALNTRAEVAAALEALPADAQLSSVGPLSHVVRYYLREHAAERPGLAPLPQLDLNAADRGAGSIYICSDGATHPLPPGAEVVAVVRLGRNRKCPHQRVQFARLPPDTGPLRLTNLAAGLTPDRR